MTFTLHSHSGEFCPGHAKDKLEAILERALEMGFSVVGLTEHMPRVAVEDLYPEELEPSPEESLAMHFPRHERYLECAQALRACFAPRGLRVLIGFETEWIRTHDYHPLVERLRRHPAVDYIVGSIHHVLGEPIDYNKAMYARACDAAVAAGFSPDAAARRSKMDDDDDDDNNDDDDNRERALYNAYFSAQNEMLRALKPEVVGHLDVVRLLSRNPDRSLRQTWPEVWERVLDSLRVVQSYGGMLECNSSALRKGLAEPYPSREIAAEWLATGGRFCLSDDSHGIGQLGTNYARMVAFLEGLGVEDVWTLERTEDGGRVKEKRVLLKDVRACVEKKRWSR